FDHGSETASLASPKSGRGGTSVSSQSMAGPFIDYKDFCNILYSNLKDSDEKSDYRTVFNVIDRNKDGKISADDLAECFLKEMKEKVAPAQVTITRLLC